MAKNYDDNDHSFTFMQDVQNPTTPSRYLQDSGFGWLNHGGRSASGVESLVTRMETLNLSSPYAFHDYDYDYCTNPNLVFQDYDTNHMHEAALHHMIRVNRAADYAPHNLEPSSGRWVSLAKDPRGSRLIQKKIDEGSPLEICKILKELKYHLHDLMKHPFGHFVIHKFFQSNNLSFAQKNAIVFLIIVDLQKLKNVCMDDQGNRVIQQILEKVKGTFMINEIADAMCGITLALMKNYNGGYVIQQCLKLFPPLYQNAILDVVAKNCVDIANDRCGCCSIQKCMEYDELPAFFAIVNKIILNAVFLAEDPYGNYVIQFLAKRKNMEVNAMLISALRYRYVILSTNKYGSNVVEDLLKYSEADHAAVITRELINSDEFLNVVQHPFGNYVVQRALHYTEEGPLYERLCDIIFSNERRLSSCLYGKMVLQCAKARV